jgi:hypothetical protein
LLFLASPDTVTTILFIRTKSDLRKTCQQDVSAALFTKNEKNEKCSSLITTLTQKKKKVVRNASSRRS